MKVICIEGSEKVVGLVEGGGKEVEQGEQYTGPLKDPYPDMKEMVNCIGNWLNAHLVWSVNCEIISIYLRTVNALEKILCANNIFSIYI